MYRKPNWDEIGFLAKIFWWLKLLVFLVVAIPVCLLESMASAQKRSHWLRTWRRMQSVWVLTFWPPLRESVFAKLRAVEGVKFTTPGLAYTQLDWEFGNLLRNSLKALVVVLVIFSLLSVWAYLSLARITPVITQGMPTPEPTAVVVMTDLRQFEKYFEFQENQLEPTSLVLILDRGQTLYSPYTFNFDARTPAPWQKISNLLFVQAMQVSGGEVELVDGHGYRHTLNTLQPFVFYPQQKFVYLVAADGSTWMAEVARLTPIKIETQ